MAERGLRRGRRPGARVPGRARPAGVRERRRADARGQPAAAGRGAGARAPRRLGMPRRTVSGLDPNRLALLIAVLGRRAGIGLASHDVYANLAGGLRVDEPGARPAAGDRPRVVAARPAGRPGTVALGEVGLLGELRAVAGLERRLREAARLGFERAIVPRRARRRPARSRDRGRRGRARSRDALAAAARPGRAGARGDAVPRAGWTARRRARLADRAPWSAAEAST